jgi:serine/threonine-protein kinase
MVHLAGLMASRYAFLSLLGAGGSGTVYEVRNLALDRREALKVLSDGVLDEGASERFAREARIAASLDHPGIVKIHSFGRESGIHWYSMSLVEGPTLEDLVARGWRLEAAMLPSVAIPILEALAFSHARGVIHRDIKPANILFDLHGHPFLTDFGIAKTGENVLKTRTGLLMGTPAYVSPEQALGEAVDARADQYSLGITLYKALSGRLPFTSDGLLQTLVLRLNEDPEPLERHRPDLGPDLSRIIMRTLARDRDQRWDSITDLKDALVAALGTMNLPPGPHPAFTAMEPVPRYPLPDLQVTAPLRLPERGSFDPTAELSQPAKRTSSRSIWAAASAAAACVVLGVWFWNRRPAPTPVQVPIQVSGSRIPGKGDPEPSAQGPRLAETKASKNPSPVTIKGPGGEGLPGRRVAVYPQLVEAALKPAEATPSACAGLRVNVSLVVGEDGLVKHCKVLSSLPPECAEAAKALALRYRFKPALDVQGEPLESTVAAAVDFPEAP